MDGGLRITESVFAIDGVYIQNTIQLRHRQTADLPESTGEGDEVLRSCEGRPAFAKISRKSAAFC